MGLITTVGGSSSNSYVSRSEADQYHEGHVNGRSWIQPDSAETEDLKEPALIQATRMLDQYVDWFGYAASSAQSLGWPRYGVVGANGYAIGGNVIPVEVKNATAELARQVIERIAIAASEAETATLKSMKVGPIELEFKDASGTTKPIPDDVFFWVRRLGSLVRRGCGSVRVVRV